MMSWPPVGEALAQARYPGKLLRREIYEIERAGSHCHELSDHLRTQQTPVPTTEYEQYSVASQLIHKREHALHHIACKHLEILKRDLVLYSFVPHGP